MIPTAVFMQAHCVTYMLQIVWDTGSQKRLSNPLYQLVQLLSNSATAAKVHTAFESLAFECDVLVGLQPQDQPFNSCVLDHTVRHRLRTLSFFKKPGGSRHNPEIHAAMRESIAETCSDVQRGLSSSRCFLICHTTAGVAWLVVDVAGASLQSKNLAALLLSALLHIVSVLCSQSLPINGAASPTPSR